MGTAENEIGLENFLDWRHPVTKNNGERETNQDRNATEIDTQQKVKGHWTISFSFFSLSRLSFVQKHEKKDFYILHAVNMVLNIWHNYSLNFQVRQRVGKLEKNRGKSSWVSKVDFSEIREMEKFVKKVKKNFEK